MFLPGAFKATPVDPVAQARYRWTDNGYHPLRSVYRNLGSVDASLARLQNKFEPRIIATVGAIVLGIGMYVTSFVAPVPDGIDALTPEFRDQIILSWPAVVGIGILTGSGVGLGCACATPVAIKWFPPTMKGPLPVSLLPVWALLPCTLPLLPAT